MHGDKYQRYGAAGDKSQLPVDGKEYYEHTCKCNKVGDEIRYHMSIKKLEISGIVNNTAHKVTGLLIMKESQIKALQFVVETAPQVSYKIPCSPVSEVVAQKSEKYTQKI